MKIICYTVNFNSLHPLFTGLAWCPWGLT